MIERHGLGKAFGAEATPAPEQIGQLSLGQPQRARKPGEIGDIGPMVAEIADRGLNGLIVVLC